MQILSVIYLRTKRPASGLDPDSGFALAEVCAFRTFLFLSVFFFPVFLANETGCIARSCRSWDFGVTGINVTTIQGWGGTVGQRSSQLFPSFPLSPLSPLPFPVLFCFFFFFSPCSESSFLWTKMPVWTRKKTTVLRAMKFFGQYLQSFKILSLYKCLNCIKKLPVGCHMGKLYSSATIWYVLIYSLSLLFFPAAKRPPNLNPARKSVGAL